MSSKVTNRHRNERAARALRNTPSQRSRDSDAKPSQPRA